MHIHARVKNQKDSHSVSVSTDGHAHSLNIASKPSAYGSSINGGELLFLALATCYCNDVYREAGRSGMLIERVEVEVEGDFGGIGEAAQNVTYRARVTARGSSEVDVEALLRHTDTVSEIQNTLRVGVSVQLSGVEVEVIS